MKNKANHHAIADANRNGFTINLSAGTMEEADELVDTECGPVTVVVPAMQMTNTPNARWPEGRHLPCPSPTRHDVRDLRNLCHSKEGNHRVSSTWTEEGSEGVNMDLEEGAKCTELARKADAA